MKPINVLFLGFVILVTHAVAEEDEKEARKKNNKLPDEAKAILTKAEKVELFSLEPGLRKPKPKDPSAENTFHGWEVLGNTEIIKADARKELFDAVEKGIESSEGRGANCFYPRHAIRATVKEKTKDRTVDLVICFECGWIYVFLDKDEKLKSVATSGDHQKTLDKILKAAKVPLPPPVP